MQVHDLRSNAREGDGHTVLAERLSRIRSDLNVLPIVGNVRTTLFGPNDNLTEFDLVIDANVDASVRGTIESARKNL